jgi:hypothetical protein
MRRITYGFYGEDVAQKLFLGKYLYLLPEYMNKTQEVVLQPNENFHARFGLENKARIDNQFVEVGIRGFLEHRLDLYFVGRDCDENNEPRCKKRREEMESQIEFQVNAQCRGRTIVSVPVQCVEHWLLYVKRLQDYPGSTKNDPLEHVPNADAKNALYGKKKVTVKYSEPIVRRLIESMDIKRLESMSQSFLAFHKKAESCVKQLLA